MRQTRSALRAEAIHVDDSSAATAVSLPLTPLKERTPLGEVAGNTQAIEPEVETGAEMATGKKAKGGRKAKGKKGKKVETETELEIEQQQQTVLEDERQAAASPASDGTAEELAREYNGDIVQVPMLDERPISPPRAVRMTRRQLAKAEKELSKSLQPTSNVMEPSEQKEEAVVEETSAAEAEGVESEEASPVQEDIQELLPVQDEALEFEVKVVESPAPEVTITPELSEPKVLTSEKPSDDEMSVTRSSSRSPGRPPMRLEDSIEAIDALEEAIEQVGKAFPQFDALESGQKSPVKQAAAKPTPKTRAPATRPRSLITKAPATSRLSRNLNAPKSLKEGPTTSAVTKTRPTTTARQSLARSASVRNASKANERIAKTSSGEVTDYLASKRRPISVSFPTPPPPPKSSKPPTKSTFQLPGEAVAAKLKAQREERLKREEEEEAAKKPTFKARPVPVRKAPAPVKQTAASKARESLMQGSTTTDEKENKSTTTTLPLKRTSSITTGATGKRQSTLITNVKRQSSILNRPASGAGFNASTRERPAFNLSTTGHAQNAAARRLSSMPGPTIPPLAKPAVTPAEAATQRLKGREVFNRDKIEKEERERVRREKEDAAKRARAEAAERGRIASREWAEKQKMRKAGLPAANGGVKTAAAGAGMEQGAMSS